MKLLNAIFACGVACFAGWCSAATLSFTHDNLGRLTSIDYGDGNSITYTYNAAGNLIAATGDTFSATPRKPHGMLFIHALNQ